jgi:hypothetical protein
MPFLVRFHKVKEKMASPQYLERPYTSKEATVAAQFPFNYNNVTHPEFSVRNNGKYAL